jgi:hypothetical protein
MRAALPGLARIAAIAAACLALALAARYRLVEPAALTAACEPDPWQGSCALRSLVVETFLQQRIGWVALVGAIVATVSRSLRIAGFALAAGCAGMVLYSTQLAAPAALLAALVIVRGARQR